MRSWSRQTRLILGGLLLLGAVLGVMVVVDLIDPYPEWPAQDPRYHAFADIRTLWGVPNALNVLSNLPFVAIGAAGLLHCARALRAHDPDSAVPGWELMAFGVGFVGVTLTGFGSAYYHWAPSNETLFWDRLPMTLVFMPLVAIVLGDRVGDKWGRIALWPLVLIGVGSIVYWHFTEQAGVGDLRPYGLVQFAPLLLLPYLLLAFAPRHTPSSRWLWMLAWYGLAKVLEAGDLQVYDLETVVSGHSLKHLAAAAATLCMDRIATTRFAAIRS